MYQERARLRSEKRLPFNIVFTVDNNVLRGQVFMRN